MRKVCLYKSDMELVLVVFGFSLGRPALRNPHSALHLNTWLYGFAAFRPITPA